MSADLNPFDVVKPAIFSIMLANSISDRYLGLRPGTQRKLEEELVCIIDDSHALSTISRGT